MATHLLPHPGVNATGRPSHRELPGAAGFTALAGVAAVAIAKPDVEKPTSPAVAPPDAPLLALCARFLGLPGLHPANWSTANATFSGTLNP